MNKRLRLLASFLALALAASTVGAQSRPVELLLYCGITMVRPMTEIARAFEKRENVKIVISQGGSEDLYQSAKKTAIGDWYLPGDPTYRDKYLAEGLFGEYVVVGYNQMAMMVQKGNPKKVKPDPRELLRKDLVVIIGNAESGSVGQETKRILDQLGIYPQVLKNAAFIAPDSRSLMLALRNDEADLTMSWRATGFFTENAAKIDVIDLPPTIAKPQPILLNLLKSTRHPELAKRFMAFAAGEEGQAIFRKHGFYDNRAFPVR